MEGYAMTDKRLAPCQVATFLLLAMCSASATFSAEDAATEPGDNPASVLVVVGAYGEDGYAQPFREWAGRWERAAREARAVVSVLVPSLPENDAGEDVDEESAENAEPKTQREQLEQSLAAAADRSPSSLWLVLIGHGTFDGQTCRFNLQGPDISASSLRGNLESFSCPVAVVNCTASSGPFINALSGPNRVVVTATKSGDQDTVTRFGDYLSATIEQQRGDFDKDGQVSLLEAGIDAAARTAASYEQQGQLASENALIDDNGDRRGTRLDWFDGVRLQPERVAKSPIVDRTLASRMVLNRSTSQPVLSPADQAEADRLEAALEAMRANRPNPVTDDYIAELEAVLFPLAELMQGASKQDAGPKNPTSPQ